MMSTRSAYKKIICSLVLLALAMPAFAASQSDLREIVELAVRSDPNSANLTDAQIAALVSALVEDAQQQGVTAEDITWRPVPSEESESAPVECNWLCALTRAFGFDGSDYTIPMMLGASSLMLIFILGAVLEYGHFRHLHPKNTMPPQAPPVA